jgi:predicted house-cleaning noncanonical NTP pyrophosphatase (MazG superfamily)
MKVYNKLIRDKIPEIIESTGKKYKIEVLDDVQYKQALDEKLKEELDEYLTDDSVDELADLVEVIYAMLDYKGVTLEAFEKIRLDKQKDRGAFKQRLFLEYVEKKSE